jgi:hypothetical protein
MKIIASIPQPGYEGPRFVIEASTKEVQSLCLKSPYQKVKVTDKDGKVSQKEIKELQPGDEIAPDVASAVSEAVGQFLSSRQQIETSIKTLRGALTDLCNLTFETPTP